VAQAQLGHADPRITLMIYTHVMPGAQREAVERLETFLLFPSVPKFPFLVQSRLVPNLCKGLVEFKWEQWARPGSNR
jgi:hypothetical protein